MIELAPEETEIYTDSYHNAKLYCFSLNINGKVGWRLPTSDELKELSKNSESSHWAWYWSSDDDYLVDQNLSVRAVRTVDNP